MRVMLNDAASLQDGRVLTELTRSARPARDSTNKIRAMSVQANKVKRAEQI